MEQADATLHSFVLNLLSDAQAMSAFEHDPAAVLDHAGLSDISAADVQDVIPLVVDTMPNADALEGVLSQLPLDSVDAGQLGAIQQLQFVTQALSSLPAVNLGPFGDSEVNGQFHLNADGQGGAWGLGELSTPLGSGAASVTGDIEHGLTAAVWAATDAGSGTNTINLPGLDSVPGLSGGLPGLEQLPGLDSLAHLGGGLPGFSAVSDVTDMLDGQSGQFANSAAAAANILSGAAEMTTGALANPTDLVTALSDPSAVVSGLTSFGESDAATAAQALPQPAGAVAGQVMQVADGATSGVVSEVTSHLSSGPLAAVTNTLPTGDVSHALSPVTGIVDQVTGQLNGGALSDVTGSLTDPGHAVSTVESTLSSVQGTVQSTVSDSGVGSVASHSVVSDVTGSTGLGNLLGSGTDHDTTGLTGDLSHVTHDLLPGL